ncbi:alpha/beta hydrolase [Colwellia sp. Arc7-635]|uniref:alpha/beta fold hydrolase n=1 Tax=Colwellia sp. Arc7-635 TaxID=2497879 RepID=UPI000F8591E7|nr:alpha/beta hydrolase [Colwellia sp. Arc7-635]AZQ86109.1 alpha/beta hydrolase [Colwellia sp. Arc7-635]
MIKLSDLQAQGKFVELHGYKIFTREGGNPTSPTLLLIHGYPSASWDWESLWDELIQYYHVITLDMLGFGFSEKPKDIEYLITLQADIYSAFLTTLNISSYHILAHDYGDTVAQELLARQIDGDNNQAIIDSICFLNGGLFPETHKPVLIQKLLLSPIGFLISKFSTKQKLSKNLHRIFGQSTPPSTEVVDTLWALLLVNDGRAVMHKLIHYITQRLENRARWVGAIINAEIPIKLIAGVQDPISGAHMIEHYRKLIPNANVTELETLGHYPQIEDASAVIDAYLEFQKNL